MPGGDRTGPLGAGPRTGRGLGYCGWYNRPGFEPPAFGFRGGFGFGGRGWRNRYFATGVPGWAPATVEQETADLKTQAEWLKEQLAAIEKRIQELSAE